MSRRQALALAALAALSGCGRRGPLEPPLTATATPKPASGEDDLGGPIKAPKAPPVAPPTQSLPIDKLL
jgi:predicted small lipoprotein YifL